jgi:hypothetical protein
LAPAVFAGAFLLATVLSRTVLGFAVRLFAGCCDISTSLSFDLVDFVLVVILMRVCALQLRFSGSPENTCAILTHERATNNLSIGDIRRFLQAASLSFGISI